MFPNGRLGLPLDCDDCVPTFFCLVELGYAGRTLPGRLCDGIGSVGAKAAAGELPHDSWMDPKLTPVFSASACNRLPIFERV